MQHNSNPSTLDHPLSAINIQDIVSIAKKAGTAIMEIYERDFTIEYKDDKSPLTEADTLSHHIIVNGLNSLGDFPVLSEEGKEIPYKERKKWGYYWCADPIDGTKEFIKKNGEFTVNIALIHKNIPVLGVVYLPALGEMYYAKQGEGAYKMVLDKAGNFENAKRLPLTQNRISDKQNAITIVASKSHLTQETEDFIDALTRNIEDATFISKGSSLKLLMVAEGAADIYPRLAPTMEWDTAAADAIVRESGKMTRKYQGTAAKNDQPLLYNKEDLLNPWFIVR